MPRHPISLLAPAAFVLALASRPAQAQDHPIYLPTRDVAVTYQLGGGGPEPAQQTRLFYSDASRQLRIDNPGNGGYTVLDRGARQRMVVMTEQQVYVTTPLDPREAEGFVLNNTMQYQRQGPDQVAGVPCTNWTVSSTQATGTACVTDDGVLLRGTGSQGGTQTSLIATAVRYAPQPASLFVPPPGFHRVDAPQSAPPGAGGQ